MTPDHMIARINWYEKYLKDQGVPKKRMHTTRTFGDLSQIELLAHAHYLCDSARELSGDPARWGKANRHYTALQMCLGFARHFTLDALMEHNKFLPPGSIVDTQA